MKKLYLLILLSIICTHAFTQDDPLQKFTHSYFRSDPYKSEFSVFLNHLFKDPSITGKQMLPRTDTSLFYFNGTYNDFNPFFFKPKKVEVTLSETEVRYSESSAAIDTVYMYQLTAFTDYTPEGIEEVQKEFNRINRQYQKKFYASKHEDLKGKDNKPAGGVQHYFTPFNGIAPLSIIWGKMAGENSAVLNIVLRMKTFYNRAISPAPFYKPQ